MNKTTTLTHIGRKRSNKSELHNEVTHYKINDYYHKTMTKETSHMATSTNPWTLKAVEIMLPAGKGPTHIMHYAFSVWCLKYTRSIC